MATQFSIPAWEIPGTEEPVSFSPWGRKESDTTEQLNNKNNNLSAAYPLLQTVGDHMATRNQNLCTPCPFILSLPNPPVSVCSSKTHFTDTNLTKASSLLASLLTRVLGVLHQKLRAETDK